MEEPKLRKLSPKSKATREYVRFPSYEVVRVRRAFRRLKRADARTTVDHEEAVDSSHTILNSTCIEECSKTSSVVQRDWGIGSEDRRLTNVE